MKKIILAFAVIVSITAVSCKKENDVQPQSPAVVTPVSINVEYKITSESANVEASYMFPNADGQLEMKSETVTRAAHSVSFSCTKGKFFYLEASNTAPARKTVHVQIYINGVLFQEASSSSPSQKAIASGNY